MAGLNVLTICGSLRKGSYNAMVQRALPSLAPEGMTLKPAPSFTEFPLYNADIQNSSGFPAPVNTLADAIRAADGVIFCTPEYNFGIPGGLKNAIDWVSRLPNQPFAGKPVALQSASPGPLGGVRLKGACRRRDGAGRDDAGVGAGHVATVAEAACAEALRRRLSSPGSPPQRPDRRPRSAKKSSGGRPNPRRCIDARRTDTFPVFARSSPRDAPPARNERPRSRPEPARRGFRRRPLSGRPRARSARLRRRPHSSGCHAADAQPHGETEMCARATQRRWRGQDRRAQESPWTGVSSGSRAHNLRDSPSVVWPQPARPARRGPFVRC